MLPFQHDCRVWWTERHKNWTIQSKSCEEVKLLANWTDARRHTSMYSWCQTNIGCQIFNLQTNNHFWMYSIYINILMHSKKLSTSCYLAMFSNKSQTIAKLLNQIVLLDTAEEHTWYFSFLPLRTNFFLNTKKDNFTAKCKEIPLECMIFAFNLNFLNRHCLWRLWQISGMAKRSQGQGLREYI